MASRGYDCEQVRDSAAQRVELVEFCVNTPCLRGQHGRDVVRAVTSEDLPWERPGGTTFHFVNDGIESALDQARAAAGERDVRIAGGGVTILDYVNAGLIEEFSIALSPVLFGSGVRLFEGVHADRVALEQVYVAPSQRVTHLTYAVRTR